MLGVILIALAIAALFNSEALVRAGEGMQPGTTRDIVLSVGRPIDDVAGAIGLHLPRDGLDLAFGQEKKTASGTELETGSNAILRRNRRKETQQSFAQPTPQRPLHVLVTGDSQADFIGQRLVGPRWRRTVRRMRRSPLVRRSRRLPVALASRPA